MAAPIRKRTAKKPEAEFLNSETFQIKKPPQRRLQLSIGIRANRLGGDASKRDLIRKSSIRILNGKQKNPTPKSFRNSKS